MKKQETFSQFIERLSRFKICQTDSGKIDASYDTDMSPLDHAGDFLRSHFYCEIDWGDDKSITEVPYQGSETKDKYWQPTDNDYRECCGVWVTQNGHTQKYGPASLRLFGSREAFDKLHKDDVRIEPMPEQCIPNAVKKERYNVPFPLLRGEE